MDGDRAHRAALRRAHAKVSRSRFETTRGASAGVDRAMVTTTDELPCHVTIDTYGVVTGHAVRALSAWKDIGVALRDDFGGRVNALEQEIAAAREECLEAVRASALMLGANAVVGLRVQVDAASTSVLIVAATGTAVLVELHRGGPAPAAAATAAVPSVDE